MESQTPFGTMTDQNTDKAPTNAEVLANPGKYDGTAFDPFAWPVGGIPLIQMYFSSEDAEGQKRYVPKTWGEWLKSDPEAALAYCLVVKGGPINLRALSAGQLAKLK